MDGLSSPQAGVIFFAFTKIWLKLFTPFLTCLIRNSLSFQAFKEGLVYHLDKFKYNNATTGNDAPKLFTKCFLPQMNSIEVVAVWRKKFTDICCKWNPGAEQKSIAFLSYYSAVDNLPKIEYFRLVLYHKCSHKLSSLQVWFSRMNWKKVTLDKFKIFIPFFFSFFFFFSEELWASLAHASSKPVAEVMETWTKQMGFPVLSVTAEQVQLRGKSSFCRYLL